MKRFGRVVQRLMLVIVATFVMATSSQAEAKDMKLKCDKQHVTANKADGTFLVKCDVINKKGGARTEFVKIMVVSGVQNVTIDFPQVQPNPGESIEVEASGMLPPGVDEGVFVIIICDGDGNEDDRQVIRVRRAP